MREKENQNLLNNFGKSQANQFDEDEFLMKLREEVVDKFSSDFAKLQKELDNLKKIEKMEEIEDLLIT